MIEIDPQIFVNIGNSLINNDYADFIDVSKFNKKTYEEYKQEYIYNLQNQIKNLEKKKIDMIDEYSKTMEIEKKISEKIDVIQKRIHFKENYYRSNSVANFIIMHIKNIKKSLAHNIDIHNDVLTKLSELKHDIYIIDKSIFKINVLIKDV
jgi:RNase H-fold protein (predicted Holliday junction resolvase)